VRGEMPSPVADGSLPEPPMNQMPTSITMGLSRHKAKGLLERVQERSLRRCLNMVLNYLAGQQELALISSERSLLSPLVQSMGSCRLGALSLARA
jgi:hypothetical protein